ncbi:MAG: energy-coupling factor transporter transmembrane protein EcfT [Clostridia bacterium]|nr:energy-coupling factor transporter transmembrane protein EcfT [Clostridia bacterium]
MKTSEFKRYHPLVNFIYFTAAFVFTCLFLHPVALLISLFTAFCFFIMLKSASSVRKTLIFLLPMLILTSLINPAFNHRGKTILLYLPSGNPLTFESVYFGLVYAAMIISVILFFSCFGEIITSDKFIYLFGRVFPSLSLAISMVLSFVPKFVSRFKEVSSMRKCLGKSVSEKGISKKFKNALAILSVIVSWSLESAIDTADSMKSRGYGFAGRTAFSIYKFSKRDLFALLYVLLLSAYVIVGAVNGIMDFSCFPEIKIAEFSFYSFTVFACYFALLAMPVFIELREVKRWNSIKSNL